MSDKNLGDERATQVLRSGRFRPEIEGLRTVAFLLVAVFHIWFNRVSGGVDVFFTVAGFLITVTLLSQIRRAGNVSPGRFFGRLALRLLPPAVLVLATTLVLSALIFPFASWRSIFLQVIASATYWENWYLGFNAVDYLAVDTSRSPVQHFWAMSIQGQFYVIWFVVFLIAAWISRRRQKSVKRVVFMMLLVLVVVSFIWSVYHTSANQQFAYFSTLTRVWEFGLGSLLAIVIDRIRIHAIVAALMSWVALVVIVCVGVLLPVSDLFPGYVALIPTLAACVIIVAGQQEARWGASAVLASRPLVWLGGFGYGFYLWHWPVLVFALEVRGHARAGILTGVAVIATSLVLAWLTKKFVEDPVMRWRASEFTRVRRSAVAGALVAVLVIVGAGGAGLLHIHQRTAPERELLANPCLGASFLDDSRNCEINDLGDAVVPSDPSNDSALIFRGQDEYGNRCATGMASDTLSPCIFGDPEADTKIALIGNSHAAVWFPAYLNLAERNGWRLDSFFKNSCTFNAASRNQPEDEWRTTCDEWNKKLAEHMAESGPYKYVLTSSIALNNSFIGDDGSTSIEHGINGYKKVWQPLIDNGAKILAIRDYPRMTDEVLECARRDPQAECAVSIDEGLVALQEEALALAALDQEGAELVDMTEWFCQGDVCPAVIGNVQVYRDKSHFTNTYGETLTAALRKELKAQAGIVSK